MATVAALASGSAAVGRGPQRFGPPRRHQRTLASSHAVDDTATEARAGRRRPGARATATATAASTGAKTGNV